MALPYQLVDPSLGKANVTVNNSKYFFNYPCSSNNNCTDYELYLLPGVYTFELIGASGGHEANRKISLYRNENGRGCVEQSFKGNVECVTDISSMSGAGGYTRGTMRIRKPTKAFLSIGGSGIYGYNLKEYNTENCYKAEFMVKGGYNGGGSSSNFYASENDYGSGSGGGATDLRMEKNDYYHRVLVSGGGGGCDNIEGTYCGSDDGSGGAGGNKIAQSFFINGNHQSKKADQTSGFSFGNGGASTRSSYSDVGSGGGGWYGGYTSGSCNGGGGGGSSFALTYDAELPTGTIKVTDGFGNELSNEEYAFKNKNKYIFHDVSMSAGIWDGHGFAMVTYIYSCFITNKLRSNRFSITAFILISLS